MVSEVLRNLLQPRALCAEMFEVCPVNDIWWGEKNEEKLFKKQSQRIIFINFVFFFMVLT